VQPLRKPPLTITEILSWADSHRARTGRWPSCTGGQVHGAPGETWVNLSQALRLGLRGLPGGDTLRRSSRRSGRNVPERQAEEGPGRQPADRAGEAGPPQAAAARSSYPRRAAVGSSLTCHAPFCPADERRASVYLVRGGVPQKNLVWRYPSGRLPPG
jgi:hypothetical protein